MLCIDAKIGREVDDALSLLEEKRVLYSADAYFQEGIDDIGRLTAGAHLDFANEHTLVLMKPDAVAGRRLTPMLSWLDDNGFVIVDSERVSLNRHVTRAMWHYQWNVATPERKSACDLLFRTCDALLVLVRFSSPDQSASAAFSSRKGPAVPERRMPGQLRHLLGGTCTQMNFVHSADEPADVVRELAILLDSAPRERFIRNAVSRTNNLRSAQSNANHLYSLVEHHDLDLSNSLQRVSSAVRSRPELTRTDIGNLLHEITSLRSQDWTRLVSLLRDHNVSTDPWDIVTIANHLVEMDERGIKLLIPSLRALDTADERAVRFWRADLARRQ